MKKFEIVFVTILLLGAFLVRLHGFKNPVADWHSWRQADTSSVSRNFVKYGFDLFHPRIDNISNVQSGLENPQGYFFAEFPLYNFFQAGGYLLFGHFTIEEWGRLISIISSCISMLCMYLLVKKHANTTAAFGAIFFYAFIPYNIYYGRTILPDSLGIAFLLSGIYVFDLWIENSANGARQRKNYILLSLSIVLTACSLLVRPHLIFYSLVFVYLVWKAFGWGLFKKWQLYLFAILVVVPFGLWRLWILHYPEGIPVSAWLFNGGNIRFTGAFFYWLFAERIGKLLLGYWGVSLLVFGLLSKGKKGSGFFITFFLASVAYLVVIARGNVQHDYYQYIIMPSIVMLLGKGVDFLLHAPKSLIHKPISYVLLVVITMFSLSFGWYYIRDYFNINNPAIVIAGQAVDHLTPKNAKVLANYDGDSSFLYQTNRFGWASFEKPLPEMVNKLGADYLVIANPKSSDDAIKKEYKVVASTTQYILFDLHHKP